MNNVAIVMPVYNEERALVEVVSDWMFVLTQISGVLIVVNDGSTDRSGDILQNLKERYGEELLVIEQKNSGHGVAVIRGYEEALKLKVDYIFQTDSDNQIKSNEFFKLWEKKDNSPFILGDRHERGDSWIRIWMSRQLHHFVHFLFHSYLTDLNIPFRLMRVETVSSFLKDTPMKNAFAPNLFLSLYAEKRGEITIVKVSHRRRLTGKNSLNFRHMLVAILKTLRDLFAYKRFNLEAFQNRA